MAQVRSDSINDTNPHDSLQVYRKSLMPAVDDNVDVDDNISVPASTRSTIQTYCCGEPLNKQKLWIFINGIIWLFVSIISMPLLLKKQSELRSFAYFRTRLRSNPCLILSFLFFNCWPSFCFIIFMS